ncbi:phage tail spike protein [Dolosigranulum pigrum]
MIYLYDKTATAFKYHGRPLPNAYDVQVHYMLNDEFYVQGKHPIDDRHVYQEIEQDRIIKCYTPDGLQPFRIMSVTKLMGTVEFEAWPLFYADMRHKLVKPIAAKRLSGVAVLEVFEQNLLQDTPFTFSSNIDSVHDYHTQDINEREEDGLTLFDALDVFKAIVRRWNGEVVINGYDIRLLERVGQDKQVLLYEKKNIANFVDETSIKGVVTRLHGKSTWTTRDEEDAEAEEKTHSLRVTIDSPLIDEYGGTVYEKQYTNNDIRTENELRRWLELKFERGHIDKPERSIELETNMVDGHALQVGDGLVLKYLKHGVDAPFRMTGYIYDGYHNRYIKVLIGSATSDVGSQLYGSVQSGISDFEQSMVNEFNKMSHSLINSLGNKIIYGSERPEGNFKDGDIWFDDKGTMYIWNSELQDWEEIIRTSDQERVKRLVEELEQYWKEAQAEFDKIQAENDKKLDEFESQIEAFQKRVDEFGGVSRQDILDALEQADISEKVKEAITDAGFTKSIDDIEQRLSETAESARVTAEIVGGDGSTRYNKNRADTTNATIELEKQFVEIGSTGDDGWPVDDEGNLKELTISFEAECIPRGSSTVTVRLSTPIWYGAAIEMRPDNEFYPTADKIATGQESQLFAVYNDQYSMTVDSPWFAEKATQRVTVDSDKVVTVNPQLKTVADGNLEAEFYGEWHTEPELIFDGGVD